MGQSGQCFWPVFLSQRPFPWALGSNVKVLTSNLHRSKTLKEMEDSLALFKRLQMPKQRKTLNTMHFLADWSMLEKTYGSFRSKGANGLHHVFYISMKFSTLVDFTKVWRMQKNFWKTSMICEVMITYETLFFYFNDILLTFWEPAYNIFVLRFRPKNSSFQLPYQRHSSSADCARELFKRIG